METTGSLHSADYCEIRCRSSPSSSAGAPPHLKLVGRIGTHRGLDLAIAQFDVAACAIESGEHPGGIRLRIQLLAGLAARAGVCRFSFELRLPRQAERTGPEGGAGVENAHPEYRHLNSLSGDSARKDSMRHSVSDWIKAPAETPRDPSFPAR